MKYGEGEEMGMTSVYAFSCTVYWIVCLLLFDRIGCAYRRVSVSKSETSFFFFLIADKERKMERKKKEKGRKLKRQGRDRQTDRQADRQTETERQEEAEERLFDFLAQIIV